MNSDNSNQSTDTSCFVSQDVQNQLMDVFSTDTMSDFDKFLKEYGKIHLICGPMFSGKTSELINIIKREVLPPNPKKCLVVTRYTEGIKTHDGFM